MSADPSHSIWPGLLKWSLAQTDGLTPASEIKPLAEEDKKFLQEAFESLMIDETKRMKIITEILRIPESSQGILDMLQAKANALAPLAEVRRGGHAEGMELTNPPAKDSEEKKSGEQIAAEAAAHVPKSEAELIAIVEEVKTRKLGALEELDERVLTIDNANDFYTVGGFIPLIATLNSQYPTLQWRAAQVLATINQNNPKGQERSVELGAIHALVSLLHRHKSNRTEEEWKVIVKCLYALSGILRTIATVSSGQVQFLQSDGIQAILHYLCDSTAPERVHLKALSLMRYLIQVSDEAKSLCLGTNSGANLLWKQFTVWIDQLNQPSSSSSSSTDNHDTDTASASTTIGVAMREEIVQFLLECGKTKVGRDKLRVNEYGLEMKIKQRLNRIVELQRQEGLSDVSDSEYEAEKKGWIKLMKTCMWK